MSSIYVFHISMSLIKLSSTSPCSCSYVSYWTVWQRTEIHQPLWTFLSFSETWHVVKHRFANNSLLDPPWRSNVVEDKECGQRCHKNRECSGYQRQCFGGRTSQQERVAKLLPLANSPFSSVSFVLMFNMVPKNIVNRKKGKRLG